MTFCIHIKASSLFKTHSLFVVLQLFVPNEDKEEDSGGEEEPEPQLRPHVCVQGCGSGAAAGDVSGAHSVGQGGHGEQRIPGRTPPQLGNRSNIQFIQFFFIYLSYILYFFCVSFKQLLFVNGTKAVRVSGLDLGIYSFIYLFCDSSSPRLLSP